MGSVSRQLLSGGAILVLSASLFGCQPEPTRVKESSSSSSTPSNESASSGPSSPAPSQNSDAGAALRAEALNLSCEAVFPITKIYDVDPNLALVPGSKSVTSSVTSQQQSLENLFCDLVHLSTGETVQFGFVKLTRSSATNQQMTISALPSAGDYAVNTSTTGHFAAPTGQFMDQQFWVSVSSVSFSNPADAAFWSNLAAQGLTR